MRYLSFYSVCFSVLVRSEGTVSDPEYSVINGSPVSSIIEAPYYVRLEICLYEEACLEGTACFSIPRTVYFCQMFIELEKD